MALSSVVLASVTGVRIGVSLRTAFLVDDVRLGARWVIERAAAARTAGLDCLLVGDHHATPVPYYQNTPLLGRLLAEWGDGPFGALFLMPLWNPVLVAEHIGTLSALGRGPRARPRPRRPPAAPPPPAPPPPTPSAWQAPSSPAATAASTPRPARTEAPSR